jgi:hypothetical protein
MIKLIRPILSSILLQLIMIMKMKCQSNISTLRIDSIKMMLKQNQMELILFGIKLINLISKSSIDRNNKTMTPCKMIKIAKPLIGTTK